MKKLERLGEAKSPDGSVLTLFRHDQAYSIRVNGVELMSTRRHNSEDALANFVCDPLREMTHARVLVGGLGLGFTLKAALFALPSNAHVNVVESIGEVIAWNQNPEYGLAVEALRDERVTLHHSDVGKFLLRHPNVFDAIMLDVDNGASPLTTGGNAALYRSTGIHIAAAALRPGGRLAYWSAKEDGQLEALMQQAGLRTQMHSVRAHPTSGPWHTIYVGRAKD